MSKQFSMYGLWDEKKPDPKNIVADGTTPTMKFKDELYGITAEDWESIVRDMFPVFGIPRGLVYNANCPQCDIPFNTDNEDYRFCPKCGRIEYNKKS